MENNVSFYLGTYTPDGFVSYHKNAYKAMNDYRAYIVKGGSGFAKSFLIKALADEIEKEGFTAERIATYKSIQSIDGVIFPEIGVSIMDGDKPQSIEPDYQDCTEYIVNTGDYCNTDEIYLHKKEIFDNSLQCREYIRKTIKFLSACLSIKEDSVRVCKDGVEQDKIDRFAVRFTKREFGVSSENPGKETVRLLSAVTGDGVNVLYDTLKKSCNRIYVLDDKIGCVSPILMEQLKEQALLCGFNVISCPCPIAKQNSPEHLIVPELGIGIFTSNEIHKWKGDFYKKINASRFMSKENLKSHKSRINFNCNAQKDLIDQAANLLAKCRDIDERSKLIYGEATDFEALTECKDKIKQKILSRVQL